MKVHLKKATVIDTSSPHHGKTTDLLIENGVFTEIATDITVASDIPSIELPNLHISQGWFDSSVSFGEPGYEERETLENGLQVAAQSGFTHIALQPDTLPVTDHSGAVAYLKNYCADKAVTILPIGAMTMKLKGDDLAELYDMHQAGAVTFGDYNSPVTNPNLLKLALLYTQNFGGLVQSFPSDPAIAGKGVMNEGYQSTHLGLKGIPALAEELQIKRDLSILKYTGGKLHIPTISTKKSVALIKEAKEAGLAVTCSVAVHHLFLTDEKLKSYDTRYKVLPPLRTKEDLEALQQALQDGVIDMITSDHRPMDIEVKKTEFEYASYGTIGLESAFSVLNNHFSLENTIRYLTSGKGIFTVPVHTIKVGNKADLSLFNPDGNFIFDTQHIASTSKNSAFLGYPGKGNVYGIIHNQKINLNQ
ncbi:dihydroorotase [Aquimarina sp. ERC-38]|uniref:dihydroorotase n=1 Tax=Aquimarina sp. ERC-38 TaxID=2949996 RepID=UPI0022473571|nr:dihydroorotase [Aquimarina sp. ERC-38]UZO79674.1 dihydroorotase [Aquimarina sp. ERC-38]